MADAPHRRQLLATAGVAVAAAAAGAGWAWWRRPGEAVAPPDTPLAHLRRQALADPAGQPLALPAAEGRPWLVNFWATWCAPCVREMPRLDAAAAQHPRWQFLAVAIDRPEAVRGFLDRQPVRMPVAVAGTQALAWLRDWGNAGGGLPFTLVLAPDGTLAERHLGEVTDPVLQRWLAG